jgi:hypothetical protein
MFRVECFGRGGLPLRRVLSGNGWCRIASQRPGRPRTQVPRPSRRATCRRRRNHALLLPGGEGWDEGGLLFPSPSSGLRQLALRSPAAERRPKPARIFKCGFEQTHTIRPTGAAERFSSNTSPQKRPFNRPAGTKPSRATETRI